MIKHERFTIEVNFTVCEGLRDKVLEEIKTLLDHVHKNSLDHASNLKTSVHHTQIEGEENNNG